MRKLVCLLAVAMLAAPAFGGDITFTATAGPGDNQFTISYVATEAADVPSAFALWVTLGGGCVATAYDSASVDPCFNVAIDWASEDPCNYEIDDPCQHPIADPCEAGVLDAPATMFSLCMGRVSEVGPAPISVPSLIVVNVEGPVDCWATVDIEPDNLRGGVVGAEFGSVNMVDGTVHVVPPIDECPFACWQFSTQCHGDATGNGFTYTEDWPFFRDGFSSLYYSQMNPTQQANYRDNACGDYDHDGQIYTTDWPEFRDNFSSVVPVPTDCPADCVWPPAGMP